MCGDKRGYRYESSVKRGWVVSLGAMCPHVVPARWHSVRDVGKNRHVIESTPVARSDSEELFDCSRIIPRSVDLWRKRDPDRDIRGGKIAASGGCALVVPVRGVTGLGGGL